MPKNIDFIDDCELHGSKKLHKSPHSLGEKRNAIFSKVFREFLWDGCDLKLLKKSI